MNSGMAESVNKAVIGNFSPIQIIEAKKFLWEISSCDKLIGTKAESIDSSIKNESEAHVQDILDVLKILDKMLLFRIDYLSFPLIPHSYPEEFNNSALYYWLNRLEAKISGLQVSPNHTVTENTTIKDKADKLQNYFSIVKKSLTPAMTSSSVSLKYGLSSNPSVSSHSDTEPHQLLASPTVSAVRAMNDTHFNFKPVSQNGLPTSNAEETFQIPYCHKKAQQRKGKRQIATKRSTAEHRVKDAPEPKRNNSYLEPTKKTTEFNLGNFINDNGFNPLSVSLVSHTESNFKSFPWPGGAKVSYLVIPGRTSPICLFFVVLTDYLNLQCFQQSITHIL